MDDHNLAWERNMTSFPYHHHHQEIEENFIFGSENIFLNPIQEIQDSGAGDHQIGVSGQYWSQPLTVNGFQEGKNVIPTTATAAAVAVESLECLLSATNSNGDTTPDKGISVIFSDYKSLFNDDKNNNNNNFSGCSSGGSVTKETENDVVSKKRSSEKPSENPKKRRDDVITTNPPNPKRPRSDPGRPGSSNINFRQAGSSEEYSDEPDSEAIAQMKEMIYRAAAFRPVSFADDDVAAERPRRKNVRISSDPQTVAARQRRERISERIRVLQKLVPGGNKMDTASMLDEAANYLKFLRSQVKALEQVGHKFDHYVMSSCGNGTTGNARSTTSNMFQDRVSISNPNEDHVRVVVGVPFNHNQFPMQTHLGNY